MCNVFQRTSPVVKPVEKCDTTPKSEVSEEKIDDKDKSCKNDETTELHYKFSEPWTSNEVNDSVNLDSKEESMVNNSDCPETPEKKFKPPEDKNEETIVTESESDKDLRDINLPNM